MSFYFREKPQFGERFREKFGDDIFKELKQEFGDDADFFDQPTAQPQQPQQPQPQPQQQQQWKSSQPSGHNPMRSVFDRSFPRGFPFDDESFGHPHHRRGNNIRTHLDDLAARHPEFADQLLGPPWADIPFNTNSLHRNRNGSVRRGSQERANNQSDEDARSQASGSSAASGASGVSSHNGSETEQQQQKQTQPSTMENPARNVRAMSAPPDNRQNVPQSNGGPFVSRVDVTQQQPSQNQSQQPQQNGQRERSPTSQQQKPQSPQPQQTGGSSGNVRHIPIFVEGRDRPVLPKDVDEPDFARPQTTQHRESPVHFQRPSHYQQHYKPSSAWHFQDPFFDQSARGWGSPPTSSPFHSRFAAQEKPHHQQNRHTEQTIPTQRHQQHQQQQQPHHPQQPQQQKPHQQTEVPQAEPPKPRQQVQPKDPLEKVALVQKEVDELTEQVKQYTGNSRQDKQYMYLDEMLTRELIKLDDIETEGKDNVRQARKQAIKSIQESIALLESKAPLPDQPGSNEVAPENEPMAIDENSEGKMETNEVQTDVAPAAATEEPKATAIPLPDVPVPEEPKAPAIPMPAPESPAKAASVEAPSEQVEESKEAAEQTLSKAEDKVEEKTGGVPEESSEEPTTKVSQFFLTINEPTEDTNKPVVEPVAESVDSSDKSKTVEETKNAPEKMEDRQSSPVKELVIESPKKKKVSKVSKHAKEEPKTDTKADATTPVKETKQVKTKKEAPPVPEKPEKSPKKAKKTKDTKKEPEPVSETAIPLPAPGQNI